jgi:hypothetical protein
MADLDISDTERRIAEAGFQDALDSIQHYIDWSVKWLGSHPSREEVISVLPFYIRYKQWEGSDVEYLEEGILFPHSEDLNELLPAIIAFHRNPNKKYNMYAWKQVDKFNDTL